MLRWIIISLMVLWIIATWGVLIVAISRGWMPYFRSKRLKKSRMNAVVKGKIGYHDYDPIELQVQIVQKELVFECEDGVEREYVVHDDIWDWVEVGDDGVLVFQGTLFVDFEARRPRHDTDKLYKAWTKF